MPFPQPYEDTELLLQQCSRDKVRVSILCNECKQMWGKIECAKGLDARQPIVFQRVPDNFFRPQLSPISFEPYCALFFLSSPPTAILQTLTSSTEFGKST